MKYQRYLLLISILGGGLLPCLAADCPASLESLCQSESLRGQADLLEVYFWKDPVLCDEDLPQAKTASEPIIRYPNARMDAEYALVIDDPDAPYPCATSSQPGGSYLHHLARVLPTADGVLEPAGRVIVPYAGPTPPKGQHRYQVRVYRLPSGRPLDTVQSGRGNFHLSEFVVANGLDLPAAVFQFRVTHQG